MTNAYFADIQKYRRKRLSSMHENETLSEQLLPFLPTYGG
jgi:hypothetical protein